MYNTHRAQPTVIARRRHNMFTSTESYVIKYPYGKGDLKRFLLYTWHGANCSATRCSQTMAAAATIAKGLDCPSIEVGMIPRRCFGSFTGDMAYPEGPACNTISLYMHNAVNLTLHPAYSNCNWRSGCVQFCIVKPTRPRMVKTMPPMDSWFQIK